MYLGLGQGLDAPAVAAEPGVVAGQATLDADALDVGRLLGFRFHFIATEARLEPFEPLALPVLLCRQSAYLAS